MLKRIISSILIITFLATNTDLALALAPTYRSSPIAETEQQRAEILTKIHDDFTLFCFIRLVGDALPLRLSDEGLEKYISKTLTKAKLKLDPSKTKITKNPDGSTHLWYKRFDGEEVALRMFEIQDGNVPPGVRTLSVKGGKLVGIENISKKTVENPPALAKSAGVERSEFHINKRKIPIVWYDRSSEIYQKWKSEGYKRSSYYGGVLIYSSDPEILQHNMGLILGLNEIQNNVEQDAIMLNLGSGYSPLNDFEGKGISVVNIDFEHSNVFPGNFARERKARYLSYDLTLLGGYKDKIKASCKNGPIQFAAFCTNMIMWLEFYEMGTPSKKRLINDMVTSLSNAWQTLEGNNAFVIATEPGCDEFISLIELFSNGLAEIIVIGDRKSGFENAKAIIFRKNAAMTRRGISKEALAKLEELQAQGVETIEVINDMAREGIPVILKMTIEEALANARIEQLFLRDDGKFHLFGGGVQSAAEEAGGYWKDALPEVRGDAKIQEVYQASSSYILDDIVPEKTRPRRKKSLAKGEILDVGHQEGAACNVKFKQYIGTPKVFGTVVILYDEENKTGSILHLLAVANIRSSINKAVAQLERLGAKKENLKASIFNSSSPYVSRNYRGGEYSIYSVYKSLGSFGIPVVEKDILSNKFLDLVLDLNTGEVFDWDVVEGDATQNAGVPRSPAPAGEEPELEPEFNKAVSNLVLWFCGGEPEIFLSENIWLVSTAPFTSGDYDEEDMRKAYILRDMLEERVSERLKNYEYDHDIGSYTPIPGFQFQDANIDLVKDILGWALKNNHPVLEEKVEGIPIREIIEYFSVPKEEKIRNFDALLKLINSNQKEEVANKAIAEMERQLTMLRNMPYCEEIPTWNYTERLRSAVLSLPQRAMKEAELILGQLRENVKLTIQRESASGQFTVLDLYRLHKSLTAREGQRPQILPQEVWERLTLKERNRFYDLRGEILDLLARRFKEREGLIVKGEISSLGQLSSREALLYLKAYALPIAQNEAEDALTRASLPAFISARDKIAHPSLEHHMLQNEKDKYSDAVRPILRELDAKAPMIFWGTQVLKEIIEGEQNSEMRFTVRVMQECRAAGSGRIEYYIVDYKGIIGRVEFNEKPYSVPPLSLAGREFPAVLVHCKWEGIIPKPVFSIRKAEELQNRLEETHHAREAWHELVDAYKGGKKVPVKFIKVAHYSFGPPSGFEATYKDRVKGFIHLKGTDLGPEATEREMSSYIGKEFPVWILSLEPPDPAHEVGKPHFTMRIKGAPSGYGAYPGKKYSGEIFEEEERPKPAKPKPISQAPTKSQKRAEKSARKAQEKAKRDRKAVQELREKWASESAKPKTDAPDGPQESNMPPEASGQLSLDYFSNRIRNAGSIDELGEIAKQFATEIALGKFNSKQAAFLLTKLAIMDLKENSSRPIPAGMVFSQACSIIAENVGADVKDRFHRFITVYFRRKETVSSLGGGQVSTSGISKIILNGKEVDRDEMKNKISEIAKGEFIFNAGIFGDKLKLGILPSYIEGQEMHHADIRHLLPDIDMFIGFISSAEQITLLVKPASFHLEPEELRQYHDDYIRLARFFIEYGLPGTFRLDNKTRESIEDLDIFQIPLSNLNDLANQPFLGPVTKPGEAKPPATDGESVAREEMALKKPPQDEARVFSDDKDEMGIRLSQLQKIKDKNPNEITENDRKLLTEITTYLNFYPEIIGTEAYPWSLAADILYILTQAQLTALDLPDISIVALSAIDDIGISYFTHELSHMLDDKLALSGLFTSEKDGLVKSGGVKNEIKKYSTIFNEYHYEGIARRYILNNRKLLGSLNPKILLALIYALVDYIEKIMNTRSELQKYIQEHHEEMDEKGVVEYMEASKVAMLECASNLRYLRAIKNNLLQLRGDTLVDINESIEKVAAIYNGHKGIEVQLQLNRPLPKIHGNAMKILNIWVNLFRNSIDAISEAISIDKAKEKGKIIIITQGVRRGNKEFIEIIFSDNGTGIPEDLLRDVRRFQKWTTTKDEGTGLGLYLIDQIVKELGGTIEVQSELGKGTTFTVRLPIAAEAEGQDINDFTRGVGAMNPNAGFDPLSDDPAFKKDRVPLAGPFHENLKPYIDFLGENFLQHIILLKAIRKSKKDLLSYKNLVFELAALLVVEPKEIGLGVTYGLVHDIHHYEDYKELMAVIGLAFVIASHYQPFIKKTFGQPVERVSSDMNIDYGLDDYNDAQRNRNRLAGFFRDEQQANSFVEIFEEQKNDRGEPWYIDSQIAILDALEAIVYKTPAIVAKVKKRLQKLTTDPSISNIVKQRLNEVISTLESGDKQSFYQQAYKRAINEFKAYLSKVKITDMTLIKIIDDIKSKMPADSKTGFDRESTDTYLRHHGKKHPDPVDIYESGKKYSKNEGRLKEALAQVRIDYDESIKLLSAAEAKPDAPANERVSQKGTSLKSPLVTATLFNIRLARFVEKFFKQGRPDLAVSILIKLIELKEVTYDEVRAKLDKAIDECLKRDWLGSAADIHIKLIELKEVTYDEVRVKLDKAIDECLKRHRPDVAADILIKLIKLKEVTYDKDRTKLDNAIGKCRVLRQPDLAANILIKLTELKEVTYDEIKTELDNIIEECFEQYRINSAAYILIRLLELKELTYDKDRVKLDNAIDECSKKGNAGSAANILIKLIELKEITYDEVRAKLDNAIEECFRQGWPNSTADILIKLIELKEVTYDEVRAKLDKAIDECLKRDWLGSAADIHIKLIELKEVTYDEVRVKLDKAIDECLKRHRPDVAADILIKLIKLKEVTYDKDRTKLDNTIEECFKQGYTSSAANILVALSSILNSDASNMTDLYGSTSQSVKETLNLISGRESINIAILSDIFLILISKGFAFEEIINDRELLNKIIRVIKQSGDAIDNNLGFASRLKKDNAKFLLDEISQYFHDFETSLYHEKLFNKYLGLKNNPGKRRKLVNNFKRYSTLLSQGIEPEGLELDAAIIEELHLSVIGSTNITQTTYRDTINRFKDERIPKSNFSGTFSVITSPSQLVITGVTEEERKFVLEEIIYLKDIARAPPQDYLSEVISKFPSLFLKNDTANLPNPIKDIALYLRKDRDIKDILSGPQIDIARLKDAINNALRKLNDIDYLEVFNSLIELSQRKDKTPLPSEKHIRNILPLMLKLTYLKLPNLRDAVNRMDEKGLLTSELLFTLSEVLSEIKPEVNPEVREIVNRTSGYKRLRNIIEKRVRTEKGEGFIRLDFVPAKTKIDYFYGYFAENCTSNNPEELLNPAFTPIRILKKGKIVGVIPTLTLNIEGRKSLVVCDISSDKPLADTLNAEDFVNKVLDNLINEVAVKNGYSQVLIAMAASTESNRSNIREAIKRLIQNKESVTQQVQPTFPGGTEYSISDLARVWGDPQSAGPSEGNNPKPADEHGVGAARYGEIGKEGTSPKNDMNKEKILQERERLVRKLKYNYSDNMPYQDLAVFLTKYCPNGCRHCLFRSPLPPKKPKEGDVLSWEGVRKVIDILREGNMDYLTLTGGGEPLLEKEKCLYLIKNSPTKYIHLITSGYWADTIENSETVLKQMYESVTANSRLNNFVLEISMDIFHQEKIPIAFIKNIITVLSTGRYPEIRLVIKGLEVKESDGKDSIDKLLEILPISSDAGVGSRSFPIELSKEMYTTRRIVLKNGYSFELNYGQLNLRDPSDFKGMDYAKSGISTILSRRIHTEGTCDNAKLLVVNSTGDAFFDYSNDAFDCLPSGNIYRDSFQQIKEREDRDPFIRALREEGIGYVLDIASEVEPKIEKEIDKYNRPTWAVIEILRRPDLLLYVTRRLIQEDFSLGLLDTTEPIDSRNKILPVSNNNLVKVLAIFEDPSEIELAEMHNGELPHEKYECYARHSEAAIGMVLEKKPDIIVVPSQSKWFDMRRLLQIAKHENPGLKVIMFHDYNENGAVLKEQNRRIGDLICSYTPYRFIRSSTERTCNYIALIKEAREKIMQQRAAEAKPAAHDEGNVAQNEPSPNANDAVVGVDIGGTQMSASIVQGGKVLAKVEDSTDIPEGIKNKPIGDVKTIQELDTPEKIACKDKVLEKIVALIIKAAQKAGVPVENIRLIGIGSPGVIKENSYVALAFNVPFQGLFLNDAIAEAFYKRTDLKARVYTNNDMVTALAGEAGQPYASNYPHFTYMTVSTGVNAARFDRATKQGTNFELGTREVNIGTEKVRLESLTSGGAIANIAKQKISQERECKILEYADNDINKITAKEVGDAAQNGDPLALEILDEVGGYLGWGIVELAKQYAQEGSALEEELFVVGGGVTKTGEPLKKAIESGVNKAASKVKGIVLPKIKIVISTVGSDRGILGAAFLAEMLNVPEQGQEHSDSDQSSAAKPPATAERTDSAGLALKGPSSDEQNISLLKKHFLEEEDLKKAKPIVDNFTNELIEKLWNMRMSLGSIETVAVPCSELAYNIMNHGKGGEIEVCVIKKTEDMIGIEVIGIDNGPGMDRPNELLQKSIEAQEKAFEYLNRERSDYPERGFGLRHIVIFPAIVIFETNGNMWEKISNSQGAIKLVRTGESDIKKGMKTILKWSIELRPGKANPATEAKPAAPDDEKRDAAREVADKAMRDERWNMGTARLTGEGEGVIYTNTHDEILDFLEAGDTIILFDYDPDNETDLRTGLLGPADESNWVVYAKRKGCKVFWVRPSWTKISLTPAHIQDFEAVVYDVNDLPKISGRVVVSFCLDFFANTNRRGPSSEYDEWLKIEEHKPSPEEIEREIQQIASNLAGKVSQIGLVHLAISPDYAYADYKDVVLKQLHKYFYANRKIDKKDSDSDQSSAAKPPATAERTDSAGLALKGPSPNNTTNIAREDIKHKRTDASNLASKLVDSVRRHPEQAQRTCEFAYGLREEGVWSIFQERIKSAGGTIEVQSEVGKGTTFTIRLPVATPTGNKPYGREFLEFLTTLNEHQRQGTFARARESNYLKYSETSLQFLLDAIFIYFNDTAGNKLSGLLDKTLGARSRGEINEVQEQKIYAAAEQVMDAIRTVKNFPKSKDYKPEDEKKVKQFITYVLSLKDRHLEFADKLQREILASASNDDLLYDLATYFRNLTEEFFTELEEKAGRLGIEALARGASPETQETLVRIAVTLSNNRDSDQPPAEANPPAPAGERGKDGSQPEREKQVAADLCDTVTVKAHIATKEKQAIILGLDTSWISETEGALLTPVIRSIERFTEALRERGLEVYFERGRGEEVAEKVLARQKEKGIAPSNIVVLANKDILDRFIKLLYPDPKNGTILVAIEQGQSGADLVEMILNAMRLGDGKSAAELDQTDIKIDQPDHNKYPTLFLFKPIRPVNMDEKRKALELQISEIDTRA